MPLPSSHGQGRGQPRCCPTLVWARVLLTQHPAGWELPVAQFPPQHPLAYTQSSRQPPRNVKPKLSQKNPNEMLPFGQGDNELKGWGKVRQSQNRISPSVPWEQEETGTRKARTTTPFHFFFPRERFSTKLKFSRERFLLEGSGVSASFIAHRAPVQGNPCARQAGAGLQAPTHRLNPSETGQLGEPPPVTPQKARAVWTELARYKCLRPPLSFAEAHSPPPPRLGAWGIFYERGEGRKRRGNHRVTGKNSRTPSREVQRVSVLSAAPFHRKGPQRANQRAPCRAPTTLCRRAPGLPRATGRADPLRRW